MNRQIKNIVFDLGGVIVGFDRQRCIRAFEELKAQAIVPYVEYARNEDLFLAAETGEINTHEFCDEVRGLSAIDASDEAIVSAWNKLLSPVDDDKKERFRTLGEKYRLFILSNTSDMHWNYCVSELFNASYGNVKDCFEHCYLSYVMRKHKPHDDIFLEVLEQSRLKPEETLFVDDTKENIEAAERLGLHVLRETTGRDWMEELK